MVLASEEGAEVMEPDRSFRCLPPVSWLAEHLPEVTLGYGVHDLVYGLRQGQASFWLHGCLLCLFFGLMCGLGLAHHTNRILLVNLSTLFLVLRRLDLGVALNWRVAYQGESLL